MPITVDRKDQENDDSLIVPILQQKFDEPWESSGGAILVFCGVPGAQSQNVTVDRQMKLYGVFHITHNHQYSW